jgi:hypothetical protein
VFYCVNIYTCKQDHALFSYCYKAAPNILASVRNEEIYINISVGVLPEVNRRREADRKQRENCQDNYIVIWLQINK